jgi:hypothetical protein
MQKVTSVLNYFPKFKKISIQGGGVRKTLDRRPPLADLQKDSPVLSRNLPASSDGTPETVLAGTTAKRRRDEEKQVRAYDRAFKSNVTTAMSGLSYSSLMEQANNKHTQFMNYMELSCNDKYNDSLKAKFGRMADAALESANKMESQAKQVKGPQADLSSLSDSPFKTPNQSHPPTTPTTMTTAHSSTSTVDS